MSGTTVDAVKWSPNNLLLASAEGDHAVRLWNMSTGALEHVLDAGMGAAPDMAWSKDAKLVAVAGDTMLSIWEAGTGRRLQRFEAHKNDYAVKIVDWSPDAQSVITRGSFDGALKTWNLGQETPVTTMRIGIFQALMDRFS
jgi:WD40 repeat protein